MTGKITRIIPLPRVVANQYLRSEEWHIEDETNSQTELKDNTFADAQLPLSRRSPISSDRAIQAAKTNLRPAKTSQKILPQAPEWTDIDKNVINSLDSLEDNSKLTYTPSSRRNLIVADKKISGSDRMQVGSNSTIAELSSQTTRSDQSKCSEVKESEFTSIGNTPSAVPVTSADLLPLSSSSQPMALVETESTIWNGQSRKKPIRAEDSSDVDVSTKEGATSVEVKRPPYYMSETTGQTVGLPLQLSTARPTEFESSGRKFSSYSVSAKLRLIRPASPRLLRRMHRQHPAYNPPPTPPPDSPIPPPTPPPEHQTGQIVDHTLSETLHRPAVIPQKRSAFPAIRPAKIILRQRKL
ncbi:uncharacterized protein EAE97_002010 [Botrytis byssoidea]|uniref:Uncharacterized protein n=1 Tax=Botrytis byssoidea TaxID=139641 RepID=A0A9P5IW96_9HELO|nr:uncharacterized protein EAE97_002010 [Botrytis byssoidea]KAF7952513.1 hypothetical protein EAE97_002010 [Botrytis byssoidea]